MSVSYPLPAGEVLNEAFQFGLRRWGTVLRYLWLPVILSAAIALGYGALAFENTQGLDGGVAGLSLRISGFIAYPLGAVVFAVCLFLYAGFMASIFRLVAIGEELDGFFHLRTDGPAVRVFWAVLILNVLSFAILGVSLLFSLAVTGQSLDAVLNGMREFFVLAASSSASGDPVSPAALEQLAEPMSVVFLSILGALVPLIYINVRLAPFAAASAVENRLLLFGSFQLTAGSFGSIFVVLLLVMISLFALSIIIELAATIFRILGSGIGELGGAVALVGSILLLAAFTIAFLYQIFSASVQLSTQAVIYRRLKTGE